MTSEAYKLWVIYPEILFIADQVVVDKRDYDEIKQKIGRTLLDQRIAMLIEGFANEDIVQIVEYQNMLPLSLRPKIHYLADSIVKVLGHDIATT